MAASTRTPTPKVITIVDILNNPEDIIDMRLKIFQPIEAIKMTTEEFDRYWPYLTNVWQMRRKEGNKKYFECCFSKRLESQSTGQKLKPVSNHQKCGARLVVKTTYENNNYKTNGNNGGPQESIEKITSGYELKFVQGSPLHNHDLDRCDRHGTNDGVRSAITQQLAAMMSDTQAVRKSWQTPEAKAAFAAAGKPELPPSDMLLYLARPMKNSLPCKTSGSRSREPWNDQLEEAMMLAKEEGIVAQVVHATRQVDKQRSNVLVFSHPRLLQALADHGDLALLDSTHNTNQLGWFLFTLLVRDNYGKWRPGGFFLAQCEDGDTIAAGLIQIWDWKKQWNPSYMVTDDSAAEHKAVRLFNKHSNTHSTHLLCQKHVKETLIRHLPVATCKQGRMHMWRALYRALDEKECQGHVRDAISALRKDKQLSAAAYLEKHYLEDSWRWATWFRKDSPLLLQVLTTSPLEGFHSDLKCSRKGQMRKDFSLWDSLKTAFGQATKWHDNADSVALREREQFQPILEPYFREHFAKLPASLQALTAQQLQMANDDEEEGDEPYYDIGASPNPRSCPCKFWRRYRLPCKDMWRQHLYFGNPMLEEYISSICDVLSTGYSIYKDLPTEDPLQDALWEEPEEPEPVQRKPPTYQHLKDNFEEAIHLVRQQWFRFREFAKRMDKKRHGDGSRLLAWFTVQSCTLPVAELLSLDPEMVANQMEETTPISSGLEIHSSQKRPPCPTSSSTMPPPPPQKRPRTMPHCQ